MSDTSLDDRRDVAAIHPLEFWTEYAPQADGTQKAEDWVRWAKKGDAMHSIVENKIARCRRDAAVWRTLEPFYDAWKRQEAAPVNGTPLDALPFMTKQTVTALRPFHLYTAEDLAAAEDAALVRTGVPGIRNLQAKARTYLRIQGDTAEVTAMVAERDQTIAALSEQVAEMARAMEEMAAKQGMRKRSREDAMQGALEG